MRSFKTTGISFVAGSAMTLLGTAGTAGAQDAASLAASAAEARTSQAQADEARARAADLAAQGGWAWKSGAVDHANSEATGFQAQADAARSEIMGPPPAASPQVTDAQERVDNLTAQGGWAYKSGAVSTAQADVTALEGDAAVANSAEQEPQPTYWNKPAERAQDQGSESSP
jgi:hypothetical protein